MKRVFEEIEAELNRAKAKLSGEAVRAALRHVYEHKSIDELRTGIIQTAAMCVRALEELPESKPELMGVSIKTDSSLPPDTFVLKSDSKPEPINGCVQGYAPGSVCKFCPTKGCKSRRYCSKEIPEFERAVQLEPEEKNCGNCQPSGNCIENDENYCCNWAEKSCVNCKFNKSRATTCTDCYENSLWQPKPAEPHGWEQRWINEFAGHPGYTVEIEDFIRAEIERAREGEKEATIKYINKAIGTFPSEEFDTILSAMKLDIEQNKHRSEE